MDIEVTDLKKSLIVNNPAQWLNKIIVKNQAVDVSSCRPNVLCLVGWSDLECVGRDDVMQRQQQQQRQ